MYADMYSSEFQAHSVTECSIQAYLEPYNDSFNFSEIFNLYLAYYKKIINGENYEDKKDKAYIYDNFESTDIESLKQYQTPLFSNLDKIREIINKTDYDTEKKSLLFRYLINIAFLGNPDIDYSQLVKNVDFSKVNDPKFLSDFYQFN
jgi:hypothetical protein